MKDRPLILVTNDDGIDSVALWCLAEAMLALGEVMVVAPSRQWSGAGRSLPFDVTGQIQPRAREINGQEVAAFAIDASPALAVVHGVLELAPRRPALIASGINFGVNLGSELTVSGTVGAALEGAAFGIPAMAISQEMDPAFHLSGDAAASYIGAMSFAARFGRFLLGRQLPYDMDALNINVPAEASPLTPWRLTRASRRRSFWPSAPHRQEGEGRPIYRLANDSMRAELDSDIWALRVDRVVSVTPLSLNLTSCTDLDLLNYALCTLVPPEAETAEISSLCLPIATPIGQG